MSENRFASLLNALCFALLTGCASTQTPEPVVERLEPGMVAVVAARHAPAASFNTYAQGRGASAGEKAGEFALKGAGVGALVPLYVGVAVPILLPFAVAAVPFTALAGAVAAGTAGAVAGAWQGMPAHQVQAMHSPIERTLRETSVQDEIARRVAELRPAAPHIFAYLPESGPIADGKAPDYQPLEADGFDSVLELTISSIGFEAWKAEPPGAIFEMKLRVRVVPLAQGASPWERERTHRGTARPVTDWTADDGQLFEAELEEAYRSLAQFVADSVVVVE